MNFLAHLYLSGSDEAIRLGNFIGDYVKGNEYKKYPPEVRKGILLHRQIDNFTDNHPVVRQHKSLFYQKYHKYSGIVTDILYDHFLSTQWNRFADESLSEYIDEMYCWIEKNFENLPADMQKIIPSLVKNQWLRAYATLDGVKSVLIGMSKVTSLPSEYEFALFVIHEHYENIRHVFLHYFKELILFSQQRLLEMEKTID